MATYTIARAAALLLCAAGAAHAQTSTVVHQFDSVNDGSSPQSNVVLDPAGNSYGEASFAGPGGQGTLWKLTPGNVFSVLHAFDGASGDRLAYGNLLMSGTTLYGVTNGTLFSIVTDGSGYQLLHAFQPQEGSGLQDTPVRMADGTLYGVARTGGPGYQTQDYGGYGTIWSVSPDGSYHLLHAFDDATEGAQPTGLVRDPHTGLFYGALRYRGVYGGGAMYRFDPASGAVTILHSFGRGNVTQPFLGGLTQDGYLYAVSTSGGTTNCGTLISLFHDGTGYRILHSFSSAIDGCHPTSAPARGADGFYYGTVPQGSGDLEYGVLYKASRGNASSPSTVTVLDGFSFQGTQNEPAYPNGTPAADAQGHVVFTTELGGPAEGQGLYGGTILRYAPTAPPQTSR